MKTPLRAPSVAVVAIGVELETLTPQARADTQQDNDFYRLVLDDNVPVYNFEGMRAEALRTCDKITNGERVIDAIDDMQAMNPLSSWDQSNSVVSAAIVVYCPWNEHHP